MSACQRTVPVMRLVIEFVMNGPEIDWDQMGDDVPESGFEEQRQELADMAAELENFSEEDFFPED